MRAALVITVLLAILAGAVFVGHYGWVSAGDYDEVMHSGNNDAAEMLRAMRSFLK